MEKFTHFILDENSNNIFDLLNFNTKGLKSYVVCSLCGFLE